MEADLSEAWEANLSGAQANLSGANLNEANLSGANLGGADLRGASLSPGSSRRQPGCRTSGGWMP